jgi:hypothetical protein
LRGSRGLCGVSGLRGGGRWRLLPFVAPHNVTQTKAEATDKNQAAKDAHQPHRAERHLCVVGVVGIAPELDRLKLFLILIDFLH